MSDDWDDTTTFVEAPEGAPVSDKRSQSAYLMVIAGSNVGEMHKLDRKEIILGRSADADVQLMDDGISRSHCKIRVEDRKILAEDLGSRNGTFCNGEKFGVHELKQGDKLQLGKTTILKFSYHDDFEENFQRKMLDSALRDSLTGVYNKKYFHDRLDSEIKFAVRHQQNLAVILLDLDHFKKVNDTHGHLAGDDVLRHFAEHLKKSTRNEDVLARFGGEEFAIIARSIPRNDIFGFAERLVRETAALKIVTDGTHIPITVSAGVATLPEEGLSEQEAFLKRADEMLYIAKSTGRNRVIMSQYNDSE